MNPEVAAMLASLSAAMAAKGDVKTSVALAAECAAVAATSHHVDAPMPYDVMTASQVAEYFQLPETAVIAEASAGRLPGRRVGGEWRFIRIALTEWLQGRDRHPSIPPQAGVGKEYLDEDPERIIEAIYAARRELGTVGDHFPEEEGE